MEQKCDDITMFPHPISPIFREAADLPISSLYKTKYPVPGTAKCTGVAEWRVVDRVWGTCYGPIGMRGVGGGGLAWGPA